MFNSDLGEFVREDHAHFAQILKDFKDTYSLVYIPVKDRTTPEEQQKPWAIIDKPDNLQEHVVRFMSEEEMKEPHKILAWLFEGDVVRHGADNILKRIEAEEKAKQLMDLKKREEEIEDRIEFGAFLATGGRNKKHTFTHNGRKYER